MSICVTGQEYRAYKGNQLVVVFQGENIIPQLNLRRLQHMTVSF
jgi:hypothetical protein